MSISIKELARIAGVSVTTIARALNGKPDVSDETRERILELAKHHNYRPNVLARGLVTNRTYTVGIVVPDITNPFFPAMIKGTEAALWREGYNVILADADYDSQKELQIIHDMISRRVDGIVISPTNTVGSPEWLRTLQEGDVPTVSVTRLERGSVDTVTAADRSGAEEATDHLLANGRRRIVYLGNESATWADRERAEGYEAALRRVLAEDAQPIIERVNQGSSDEAQTAIRAMIERGVAFDSILAFDDLMALGARLALVDAGLRVPQDVALVGFDNIELSRLPEVALTTVDIPKYEIGRVAADRVLNRIEQAHATRKVTQPVTNPTEIVLQTRLIVRRTCGAKQVGPGSESADMKAHMP